MAVTVHDIAPQPRFAYGEQRKFALRAISALGLDGRNGEVQSGAESDGADADVGAFKYACDGGWKKV